MTDERKSLDALSHWVRSPTFMMGFPFEDCRRITESAAELYMSLVPDLTIYWADIAGWCSWGRKLEKLGQHELLNIKHQMERSFCDRYPEYRSIIGRIDPGITPDLWRQNDLHEQARRQLIAAIASLLNAPQVPRSGI